MEYLVFFGGSFSFTDPFTAPTGRPRFFNTTSGIGNIIYIMAVIIMTGFILGIKWFIFPTAIKSSVIPQQK